MHEIVNYSVSGRWADRDVLVGQPLISHLPVRASDVPAILQTPDGNSQAPSGSGDGRSIITEPATRSGFHKLVLGPPVGRTEWFAVNVDTQESDLASLRPEELRSEVMPGVEFSYLTDWEETSAGSEKGVRVVSTSSGLARSLLLAAFCLLIIEQLMAWRFNLGAILLAAVLLVVLTTWAWRTSPISGGAMLVLISIGLLLAWTNRRQTTT
jgi:hypothetical protein